MPFEFQKETKETVIIEVNNLLEQKRDLESFIHTNAALGIDVGFKVLTTMVDGGLVNKASGLTDAHKCRLGRKRMWNVRNEGNHICNDIHFSEELGMSMLDFGHSPCHFNSHIGMLLLDIANRREFRKHGERGYADLLKVTEQVVHDEMLDALGIHVSFQCFLDVTDDHDCCSSDVNH